MSASSSSLTFLEKTYSLNYVIRVCLIRNSKRIALQLPDDSLKDSPFIVRALKLKLLQSLGEEGLGIHFFVLGDTTFGSCCVDEVAAEHTRCDLIIHFGHSCLSSVSITPTIFVFGKNLLARNKQILAQTARALVYEVLLSYQDILPITIPLPLPPPPPPTSSSSSSSSSQPHIPRVLFLWDPDCTYIVPHILDTVSIGVKLIKNNDEKKNETNTHLLPIQSLDVELETRVLNTVTAACYSLETNNFIDLDDDLNDKSEDTNEPFVFSSPHFSIYVPTLQRSSDPTISSSSSSSSVSSSSSATSICGFQIPSVLLSTFKTIIYLGSKPTRCRALIASFAGIANVIQIDPTKHNEIENNNKDDSTDVTNSNISYPLSRGSLISMSGGRLMSQRYRMVEVIRAASTIGILAGTLGVSRHVEIIDTLRTLINNAGKTSYTILVGKPNPAKLGNFPEIDVFILVACPESTLLDEELAATFPRPVATPHEAIVALNGWGNEEQEEECDKNINHHVNKNNTIAPSSTVWTGQSRFDFSTLLLPKGSISTNKITSSSTATPSSSTSGGVINKERSGSPPPPQHSLLSGGRMIPKRINVISEASMSKNDINAVKEQEQGLVSTTDTAILAITRDGTSGSFLTTRRTWRGLEYDIHEDIAANTDIVEGQQGIASKYIGEGKPSLRVLSLGTEKEIKE